MKGLDFENVNKRPVSPDLSPFVKDGGAGFAPSPFANKVPAPTGRSVLEGVFEGAAGLAGNIFGGWVNTQSKRLFNGGNEINESFDRRVQEGEYAVEQSASEANGFTVDTQTVLIGAVAAAAIFVVLRRGK